jgi:hypothetical protein
VGVRPVDGPVEGESTTERLDGLFRLGGSLVLAEQGDDPGCAGPAAATLVPAVGRDTERLADVLLMVGGEVI